jgi:hypothetical protein
MEKKNEHMDRIQYTSVDRASWSIKREETAMVSTVYYNNRSREVQSLLLRVQPPDFVRQRKAIGHVVYARSSVKGGGGEGPTVVGKGAAGELHAVTREDGETQLRVQVPHAHCRFANIEWVCKIKNM